MLMIMFNRIVFEYIINNLNNKISTKIINKKMSSFLSVINIMGWSSIICLLVYKFANNPFLFFK
jgi:hypothetical protein